LFEPTRMPSQGRKNLDNQVSSRSRSQRFHSRGLWAIKAKNGGKWPAAKPKTVKPSTTTTIVKDTKKGKRTVVRPRLARKFEAQPDGVRRPARQPNAPKIRPSIVPGRVAIILTGKYIGRRVVVLKNLQSGLTVVGGVSSLNRVPLKRISPSYLIATSLKIDLAAANATKILEDNKEHINDALFAREFKRVQRAAPTAAERKARSEKRATDGPRKQSVVLVTPRKSTEVPSKLARREPVDRKQSAKYLQRTAIEKALDTALVSEVDKTPYLRDYFRGRFELTAGQYPHNLKF